MTDQITPAMQAFWANDPAPQEMGVVLVKARDGRSELRLALESRHLNGHDTAHGGVVHLLADCAAGLAANSTEEQAVTQTNTITFLSPGRAGETLTATAECLARSGRSALFDVVVLGGDGRKVAVMRAQMRYIPQKS
ncbi:MAG: hotdog fold thioesterase [Rhodobacteraceae bacterium]|nr:hotdog fold thioesterase [Paracoccaceae bacterium]